MKSILIPNFKSGMPIRNFEYRIIKIWLQKICQTKANISVTQGLLHWLKPWTWSYLNIRYSRLDVGYPILYQYIILYYHLPNISGQYVLRKSQKIVHQNFPFHSDHFIDGALCFPILMWGASPTKPCIFSASQTDPT